MTVSSARRYIHIGGAAHHGALACSLLTASPALISIHTMKAAQHLADIYADFAAAAVQMRRCCRMLTGDICSNTSAIEKALSACGRESDKAWRSCAFRQPADCCIYSADCFICVACTLDVLTKRFLGPQPCHRTAWLRLFNYLATCDYIQQCTSAA